MAAPVTRIVGRAIPLGRANVDTDLIIPAAHLKTLGRDGLGAHVFAALRTQPGSPFDDPQWQDAPILIAGENFGCGSSREHAVWALLDRGISAVVAPSFSDIFAGNAARNGLLAVSPSPAATARLLELARLYPVTVDLAELTVESGGESFHFEFDPFRRACLLQGLDEIGMTLEREDAIANYEARSMLPGAAGPAERRAHG